MPPKDVEIVLTVDVDGILSSDNSDEAEIIKYCCLSDDNNGQGNVKDFKSQIYGGKYVEWKAKSKGRGTVKLVLISINSGSEDPFEEGNILNHEGIKGRTKGRVKTEGIRDKESNYTIYFRIKKGLRTYGPYLIDPKLQANTQIYNGKKED